ncbi:MAG TPA: MBL fold metallo-hydrolase [Chitinophagaceae bacterium]|nr:MBL fold metallo-hydrolase [Chitinophagaceae bacterium]
MKKILAALLSLSFLVLFRFPLAAQGTLPSDATARVEMVTKNVYVILHDDATDEWPHSNVGIIIGDKDVMVIDANYLPQRSRDDIALIKKLTSKPVKYLVYTHWHFDHNNGAVAYTDNFPGIEIICEKESAKFVELNATWWSKMCTAPNSNKRNSLKALEDALALGKDTSTGKPITQEEIAERQKIIAQRKNELQELTNLKVITPNRTFEGSLELNLGNKRVQLKDWGKANSPHDVTIYLPDEQVIFTGDIIVQSPLPYTGASWPLPWVKVIKQIEGMPLKKIVPGHGPVQNDLIYVRQVRNLIEATITKVEALIREGKTLPEVQKQLDLSEHLKAPWNMDKQTISDFKIVTDTLAERVWRGVRGQG